MSTKEYYREVAEEIRLLLIGRTLIGDKGRAEVKRTKKSPNIISVYINNRQLINIQMVKNDKFIVYITSPFTIKYNPIKLNCREALHDFIVKEFI